MSGRRRPPSAVGRDLLVEVAVGDHAGHLDHPTQLHLAPAAPGLRASAGR